MSDPAQEVIDAMSEMGADAAVVLHEPGQFTDTEIANMGLGRLLETRIVNGKRIRIFTIQGDRALDLMSAEV